MHWCHFTFEAPHPEDASIRIRFLVQYPVPPAAEFRPGDVLEQDVIWGGFSTEEQITAFN